MADDPDDECECGDYRRDHKDGVGRCCMPDDLTHGNRPCFSFRLAFPAQGTTSREARAAARAALTNTGEGNGPA